jgi:hypothetical protein
MKIIRYSVLLLTLGSITITQTGCFGTFALTRKAYNWHDGVSNNKFVKSLLLWIPMAIVYSITAMLDVVIFNLIEFWSGSNPLSMNEGDHEEQLVTFKGERFRIEATKDTFTTTQLSGEKAGEVRILKFDRTTRTWIYTDSKVCGQPVMTFLDDEANAVRVYTGNGAMDLSQADLANTAVLQGKLAACTNDGPTCSN